MRYLHTKLIDLTVKVQLDCPLSSGSEGSLSGAEELGLLLRKYGEWEHVSFVMPSSIPP